MRRGHLAAWAPHCPVCARRHGTTPALGLGHVAAENGEDVSAGILLCADPACRHEYPVVDGIPVIMPDLRRHLGERGIELLLREDLDPALLSLLGDALGPESWLDVLRQTASTYVHDGYADLDPQEQAGDVLPGAARRGLEALLRLAAPWNAAGERLLLDVGCAAGRTSFDLAAAAPDGLVLGVDTNLALLRVARRMAREGRARYGRRRIGIAYDERGIAGDLAGRERVDFWACDAAALPFSRQAGLVAALNVLDCVPDPRGLLAGLARTLRTGGRLLLATPFDWSPRATPVEAWIGGHSQRGDGGGAAEPFLRAILTPGAHPQSIDGLRVAATGECGWHTRLHDRAAVSYRSHLMVLERKA